jgi:hypothetical protein
MMDSNQVWQNPVSGDSASPQTAQSNAPVSTQPTQSAPAPSAPATQAQSNGAPNAAPAQTPGTPPHIISALHPMDAVAHKIGRTFQATLESLSGGPEPHYAVDPNTGKMTTTYTKPTPGAQWRRIISGALLGLSAGANTPERPGAEALSGFAAGSSAAMQQAQQQAQQGKAQAKEDFERNQQLTLQKFTIAHQNQNTIALHFANMRAQNDLEPEFKDNRDMGNELEASGVHVEPLTMQQLKARTAADPSYIASHIIRQTGWIPVTDESGNAVIDAKTNEPMQQMGIISIDGLHDDKIKLPEVVARDAEKYLPFAGASGKFDQLEPGAEISMRQFAALTQAVQSGKRVEAEGWLKPQDVLDAKGNHLQMNTNTHETRPYPEGTQPNEDNKVAESRSRIDKNAAETKEANARAANVGKPKPGAVSPDEKELKSQVSLLKQERDAAEKDYNKTFSAADNKRWTDAQSAYEAGLAKLSALHAGPPAQTNQLNPNALDAKTQTVIGIVKPLPPDQQKAQIESSQTLTAEEKQAAKTALGLK